MKVATRAKISARTVSALSSRSVSELWDESLYAGSAEFYAVGRFPYPQRLAAELESRFATDGHGRLLDLGCGPGSLTLLLAPLFGAVVAVDADLDMLRVGQARASERGIENVQWVHARAEALSDDVGRFDMVTLAQSFHWMDRPVVANKIRGLLTPDGVCVHVGATTHEGVVGAVGLPHPAPPRDGINELVRRYLGPHRRAGQKVVTGEPASDEDEVFRAAGYRGPERIEIPAGEILIRTEIKSLPRCCPCPARRRICSGRGCQSSSRTYAPCSRRPRRRGSSPNSSATSPCPSGAHSRLRVTPIDLRVRDRFRRDSPWKWSRGRRSTFGRADRI